MWDWLGTQAQSASPFVAVFCLVAVGVLVGVIRKLWIQHIEDHEAIMSISKASNEANSAVALAIEKSTGTTILAISGLKDAIAVGSRRR